MKILFYEMKNFELEFLLENISNLMEPNFFKSSLNKNTFICENNRNTEAISVFVSSKLDKETLEKFLNLKYIFLRCTGYSNIDLKYCKEKNIKVYNVPDYGSSTVAEYAFLLILSLLRKISKTKKNLQNGVINSSDIIGFELSKKTLGIVGAGKIGRKAINIAHGFNMDVLIYDKEKLGAYNFVELDELLKKSDVVLISCPLTNETKGMINRNTLSMMQKNSILINISRGEIVKTKDLYMALVNKKIQGAGLDVIECEETLCSNYEECNIFDNLKNYCLKKYFFIQKLMQMDNVIITPHNAYNTYEANKRILKTTISNINCALQDVNYTKNLVEL